jgi:large subunit ribosomal protein L33
MDTANGRRILVRLVSTALSGFFYTTTRPRLGEKLAMMKYDPKGVFYESMGMKVIGVGADGVVKQHVLFTEAKIK